MEPWVTIAILSKARGNKGELYALSLSDAPDRFEKLERVSLFRDERPAGEWKLESAWWHKLKGEGSRLVLKLEGVDSIDAAAQLEGCELRVPLSERAPLEQGAYYQTDLIGCELEEAGTGRKLGRVTGWQETGGPGLMEIDEDWLVPFAATFLKKVDVAAKRIVVDLPEGLAGLNAQ